MEEIKRILQQQHKETQDRLNKVEQIYSTALCKLIEDVNSVLSANDIQAIGVCNSYAEFYDSVKTACTTEEIDKSKWEDLKRRWLLPYKNRGEVCPEINFEFDSYKDLYAKTKNLCRKLAPAWEKVLSMLENFLVVANKWKLMSDDIKRFERAYRPYIETYKTHLKAGNTFDVKKFEEDRKRMLSQIKRSLYIQLDVQKGEIVNVWAKVPTKRFPLPEMLLPIFSEKVGLTFEGDMEIKYFKGRNHAHIYKCIVEVAESFAGFFDAVNGEQRNTFRGREIERLYPFYCWFKGYSDEWKILRISFAKLVEILLDFSITDSGNEFRYRTKPKWDIGIRVATLSDKATD